MSGGDVASMFHGCFIDLRGFCFINCCFSLFSVYKLVAFISHMGTSTQVGHYVCHILKEDRWVIFNDSKVAISQNPPKDLGYLYLYKRV